MSCMREGSMNSVRLNVGKLWILGLAKGYWLVDGGIPQGVSETPTPTEVCTKVLCGLARSRRSLSLNRGTFSCGISTTASATGGILGISGCILLSLLSSSVTLGHERKIRALYWSSEVVRCLRGSRLWTCFSCRINADILENAEVQPSISHWCDLIFSLAMLINTTSFGAWSELTA